MLWAVVIHCVLPYYTITSGKGGGHSWVYRSVVGLSRHFTRGGVRANGAGPSGRRPRFSVYYCLFETLRYFVNTLFFR